MAGLGGLHIYVPLALGGMAGLGGILGSAGLGGN